MAMEDQFTEIAYIAISDTSSHQYQFGTITKSIELNIGDKDVEQIVTVAGGRMVKFIPQEMAEISFDIVPVGMSTNTAVPNGLLGWFIGADYDAASSLVTRTRHKFRVTVLWTNDTTNGASNAAGAINTAGSDSFRISFWGCYMTTHPIDFDGELGTKVIFKCPPFNKAGSGMIKCEEAVDGTLATLDDYTGNTP